MKPSQSAVVSHYTDNNSEQFLMCHQKKRDIEMTERERECVRQGEEELPLHVCVPVRGVWGCRRVALREEEGRKGKDTELPWADEGDLGGTALGIRGGWYPCAGKMEDRSMRKAAY